MLLYNANEVEKMLDMLGNLIKSIRTKKHMTKTSIAKQIGVDTGYLTHIENGDRKPTVKVLQEICNAIDVPYQKFFAAYNHKIPQEAIDYEIFKHTAEDRILLVDDINDLHFMKCPPGLNSVSFGIRLNDDSMDKIYDKYSYVFVDFGAPIKPQDIGLFYYNGQILVRRLFIYGKNHISLYPDNPKYPKIMFNDVIGCRDDIMIYLIDKGVAASLAFKIMESVRKGKGLSIDQEELLLQHQIPSWFIESCKKIKYLFPKAHATAYVIMALRISWFKVHRPIYYYAAYFSKRAKEFDAEAFAMGKNAIRNRIIEIESKIQKHEDVSNKEIDLLDELKIALEMTLRGYTFKQIDINISDATNLVIAEDRKSLYLPFVAVESLGETVALSIVEARKIRPFSSKKDLI